MTLKKHLKKNIEFLKKRYKFFIYASVVFLVFLFIGFNYPYFFQDYKAKLMGTTYPNFLMTFAFILFNNISIAFIGMMSGFLYGIIPLILLMFNGYMLGSIFSEVLKQLSVFEFVLRLLPHGIFEIPAMIISLGVGISAYQALIKKKKFYKNLKITLDVFFSIILPLIIVGSIVETILIANMNSFMTFVSLPKVKFFVLNLLMAYLFYGALKSFINYLKKRDMKQIAILIIFLIIASDVWMANYAFVVQDFFEKFKIFLRLMPIAIFIGFLYLEHQKYKEQESKKMIQGAFQQYVSPAVINEIMKDPDKLKLGGEKKNITVFFSDIRGFTTISEKLTPVELVHLLNEYLSIMTDIVLDYKGVVDKYMGDAIMAFWGAPIDEPNHAELACLTSLKMMRELEKLNVKLAKKDLSIDIGIGLNTGDVVVGNMGSNKRFDYTIMGDSVNLGARLEGINKQYGTNIIISEFTYKQIKGKFVCRELDFVKVKGKKKPVTIYELVGEKVDNNKMKKIVAYEKALNLYKEQKFTEAKKIFLSMKDFSSKLFVDRCSAFIKENPGKDWDGAWEMKTK